MNSHSMRYPANYVGPGDDAEMAFRIEQSLELRDRTFSAYCSRASASVLLQVAIAAHSGRQATIKSLAAELSLSPSTASRTVRRLVSNGLLTAMSDLRDKRRTIVRLTATSESLATQYLRLLRQIFYGNRIPSSETRATNPERRRAASPTLGYVEARDRPSHQGR